MIGRTLSHYRIVGQLGAGGMGIVYSAEDTRLGRQVALKFVSSDFADDEQAILRLRSEARAASALNHPNICTIYDIGEADGHPFIVMELMKGQSLRDRLNSGPLKVTQLVDIGTEVADALHAAHSEGIIHRDIKPGNVFITERGHVKILDFGLAKLTSTLTTTTTTDPAPHTSAAGVTHGTPAYMSPEQATGENLDPRTDLFSLGVVLYEAATGQHPFPGKTSAVVLAGILDRAPASPLVFNPDLPLRFAEIISNCLEKDRELRYQSAADLRADLKRLRRDLDSGAVRPIERSGTGPLPARSDRRGTGTGSSQHRPALPEGPVHETTVPLRPKPRVWVWAAAAAALVLVAVLGWAFWPRGSAVAPETQAGAPPAAEPSMPPPAPAAPPPVATERQLASATASLQAGNYRAALASAREVLAINPDDAAAERIRDEASAMLARFDVAVAETRRRLAAGDLTGAARALDSARSVEPSSAAVIELSARLAEASRVRETARAARSGAAEPAPPPSAPAAAPTVPVSPAPQPQPPASPLPTPPSTATVPAPSPAPRPAEPPPKIEPPSRPPENATKPAPPPVKEPPSATTPPAAAAANDDDAEIRQVIQTYGRAIENKDIALFRSIKPNLTAAEERRLQDGFRAVSSQRVSLTVMSLERKGDTASAVVRRRDEIEAGGRRQVNDTRQVLVLSRTPAGWVIVQINAINQ